MARTPPPLGGVAFALALTSCARAGLLLAPISCLARAITPRAPSADRLRGAIGATQNTLQSLSCRGQYGCSVVKGVPPAPDCPCIALASCLARAAHGLTDPHVHAQTTSEFLRQPELSAPVGGRALVAALMPVFPRLWSLRSLGRGVGLNCVRSARTPDRGRRPGANTYIYVGFVNRICRARYLAGQS